MIRTIKFGALTAMALMMSAAVVGPAQATALPMTDGFVIAQAQVPLKCQKIQDPVKRQDCLKEYRK